MKNLKNLHPNCKAKIRLDEIIRIEADINYCHFILQTGKKIILARTLKLYEDSLSYPFIRINKSCMINLLYLDRNLLTENKTVRLTDGFEAIVSRRRVENVSKAIQFFNF